MSERRWNPVLQEWVVTATHRQARTFKPPADYCPFCPSHESGHPTAITEDDYDIAVVENGFPSLQREPPAPAIDGGDEDDLFSVGPASGVCEVVLFTSDHDGVLSEKPVSQFHKLVQVWQDRYRELGSEDDVEYVFVFENKGEEMGVTLQHPHGQIYAYPFVPPVIERELESSAEHVAETGDCLFCTVRDREEREGERVVVQNDSFTAVVPFFARYAYEVHVYANEHRPSIDDLDAGERRDLAAILKRLLVAYDSLFDAEFDEFPYVMATHQQPTDGSHEESAHFHLEFYPPYRTAEKLKYLAGSERGAGTYINNTLPEESAAALREVAPESDDLEW
ncbi:galactose-1-phosphate uridylyltransferase [Halomontanus rarus]|uniref:galactose-1-phosphate uridylyltransferase n=1 Tax=Halomontanus rarus TaxID=3034020 RepID=UPI0023E783A0|nr:galactose-1-phosphate uridylyltransferase [Halovivax sp. TS33]